MFLIRFFKNSILSLKGIFNLKDEQMYKFIIYFIIVVTISLLPHNLEIVREKGFKLGFISEGYNDSIREELYNSSMIKIGFTGLYVEEDFIIEEYDFDEFKLIIDYNDEYIYIDGNTLILKKDSTIFHNENGSIMTGNYDSFDTDIYKYDLMFNDSLYQVLFTNLEKAFYPYTILFSLLINFSSNILMYVIMIFLMSSILSFLKYRYSYFLSYKQLIKILILSMTLPSVIVFILGLLGSFAFTPVIMNFMMGGISLLVILKVGKNCLM